MRRTTVVAAIAALTVLGTAAPAVADTQSTGWRLTYTEVGPGGLCMKGLAQQGHDSTYRGGVFVTGTESWAWTWTPWTGGYDCGAPVYIYKWANQVVYKWNGATWDVCYNTPWHRSSNTVYRHTLSAKYKSNGPCGSGYYTLGGWTGIDRNGDGAGPDVARFIGLWEWSYGWFHWFPS